MFIRSIEIDGVEENITIAHTDAGALVTAGAGGRVVCEVRRDEPGEARYAKAYEAAKYILGRDKRGRPAGTNSMIHEVWTEIDRVAGC